MTQDKTIHYRHENIRISENFKGGRISGDTKTISKEIHKHEKLHDKSWEHKGDLVFPFQDAISSIIRSDVSEIIIIVEVYYIFKSQPANLTYHTNERCLPSTARFHAQYDERNSRNSLVVGCIDLHCKMRVISQKDIRFERTRVGWICCPRK